MTRRCSHCNSNGHNSRTCPARGGVGGGGGGGGGGSGSVKLFGVRLTDGSIIKKSASMGNLSLAHYHSSSSPAASPNPGSPSSEPPQDPIHVPDGYLSDDPVHASYSTNRRSERKKGVPWTEEEHRLFLLGLQKLGKGDWRGISRNYVISRTPTQVASHAQKYFIRQVNATRRKRRSSLFDMVPDVVTDPPPPQEEQFMLPPQADEAGGEGTELPTSQPLKTDKANSLPSLDLYLKPDFEPMETCPREVIDETKEIGTPTGDIPPVTSSFFPAFFPIPFPMWPSNVALLEEDRVADFSHHQVLKPIPVLPKEPVNVDELVGMSQLSLGETGSGHKGPSPLSLKLLGEPSARLSAFHARRPANVPDINKGSSSHAFQSMRQI